MVQKIEYKFEKYFVVTAAGETVNESTDKQCLEHCSGFFHIWYKSFMEAVTGS